MKPTKMRANGYKLKYRCSKLKTDFKKVEIDGACDQEVNYMNSGSNGVIVQAALKDFTKARE